MGAAFSGAAQTARRPGQGLDGRLGNIFTKFGVKTCSASVEFFREQFQSKLIIEYFVFLKNNKWSKGTQDQCKR